MKKLVNGIVQDCSPEEVAEFETQIAQSAKNKAFEDIKTVRDNSANAPIEYNGLTFSYNPLFATASNLGIERYWWSDENKRILLSPENLNEIVSLFDTQVQTAFDTYMNEFETLEEV